MPRPPAPPSMALATKARRLLRLLRRRNFRRENLALLQEAYPLIARLGSKPGREWNTFLEQRVLPFIQKWRAAPAIDWWLVLPSQTRAERPDEVLMMLTGEWGIIPVFPWTTDADVLARARQIRRRVGKRHRDSVARHRGPLSRWLETNGIPRREIPRLLGWREDGSDRPTAAAALADLSVEQEAATIRDLSKSGMSYRAAERRVLRELQGSEAPAAGMLRKMQWRYDDWRRAHEAALASPRLSDPVGFALTRVLRARYVTRDLPELTRALQALFHALSPKRRRSAARKAPPPGT